MSSTSHSSIIWKCFLNPLFLSILVAVLLAGCDSPQSTVDSLRKEIQAFRANPNDQTQLMVEQSFAKLDKQITKIEVSGKPAEAAELRSREQDLRADYTAAKLARNVNDATKALQGIGDAFQEAGKTIGDSFKKSTNSGD